MPLAEIMTQHKYLGLPSFESVSRTRRKLQAQHPELAGSRPVPIWQMDERYEQTVMERLSDRFGDVESLSLIHI